MRFDSRQVGKLNKYIEAVDQSFPTVLFSRYHISIGLDLTIFAILFIVEVKNGLSSISKP